VTDGAANVAIGGVDVASTRLDDDDGVVDVAVRRVPLAIA